MNRPLLFCGQTGRSVLLAAGLLGLTLLGGCSGQADVPQASDTPHDVRLTATQQKQIQLVALQTDTYREQVAADGVVDFDHNKATAVLAPFSGPVAQVLVTLGQHVHKGQPMARVESPDFAAAVGEYRRALAEAQTADSIAANDRRLYAQHAISRRENTRAQADAVSADATRKAARQALVALHMSPQTIADIRAGKPVHVGQGVIRAPIAGTVVRKSIAPGQTLAAGATPCFTLADTSSMWVMAQLFADEVAHVHVGDPVDVLTGEGQTPITGKVTRLDPVIDPATRSVTARVEVHDTRARLRQQMYVRVLIHSRTLHQGLLVPVSAVLRNDENLPFVYVLAGDGGYARRRVRLGERVGQRFVVSSGLHAGDKVVASGSLFLDFMQTQ